MHDDSSDTLRKVRALIEMGNFVVSSHGYDELAADDIAVAEATKGLTAASVVEDYPDYFKGPCVLVLQRDSHRLPIHVVWGIPKGRDEPAVLITAYRPDPDLWEDDLRTRRSP